MYIGRVQLICSHPERTQGEGAFILLIMNVVVLLFVLPSLVCANLGLHFVLFGATGDLAYRKLFPALSVLHKNHDLRIIGIGSSGHTSAEFRQKVLDRTKIDEESFLSSIDYVGLNVSNPSAYAALAEPLLTNPRRRRIVYLSLPPSLFSAAVDGLALAGLIDSNTEVVCEKPFGHSHSDAVSLSTSLLKHLRSDQLHLIDHYLGKPGKQA
jgi:glucose-6-phosphate 1-dehydrogenase